VANIVASGLTVRIEVVLNDAKDMIHSLNAVRDETSGVSGDRNEPRNVGHRPLTSFAYDCIGQLEGTRRVPSCLGDR